MFLQTAPELVGFVTAVSAHSPADQILVWEVRNLEKSNANTEKLILRNGVFGSSMPLRNRTVDKICRILLLLAEDALFFLYSLI